jgi:excisionase family DNA binding protein
MALRPLSEAPGTAAFVFALVSFVAYMLFENREVTMSNHATLSDTLASPPREAKSSDRELQLAAGPCRHIATAMQGAESVSVRIGGPEAEAMELPMVAVRLLQDILEHLAQGHGVSLIPVHAELTTQQAADMLNVSRTHLVQLLDQGEIPHRLVGTHRRVPVEDLLEYRRRSERARRQALDALTAQDQDLGLQ